MSKRLISLGVCALFVLALSATTGCSSGLFGGSGSEPSSPTVSTVAPNVGAPNAESGTDGSRATAGAPDQKGGVATTERLVILNAAMQLRVSDLAATIASLRALTKAAGGSVSELTVTSNSDEPDPAPAGSDTATARIPGPATASLTLRIPAAKLPELQTKVAGLGRLISQSSNESDVTQQHIDLAARLKNLRAEEVRLRALLSRAGRVTDLLEVERELSRVRGEIESMQAQLAYLEGQAAMATLSVALEQPGPVVRPSAGGWGLVTAVTNGVQGAAELLRLIITSVIALSPLLVLGALLWLLIAWRVRWHHKRLAQQMPQDGDASSASDPGQPNIEPRNNRLP
jgi:hypothetical protein